MRRVKTYFVGDETRGLAAHEVTRAGNVRFLQQVSDGNLPASVETWVESDNVLAAARWGADDFRTIDDAASIRDVATLLGTWNAWTEAADCSFTRYIDGDGRSWGHLVDASDTAGITPTLTFSSSKTWSSTDDWFEITFIVNSLSPTFNLSPRFFLYRGGTEIIRGARAYRAGSTYSVQTVDNATSRVLFTFTLGDTLRVRYTYATDTTHTINAWINGVQVTPVTYTNLFGNTWSGGAITKLGVTVDAAAESDTLITDLRASWLMDKPAITTSNAMAEQLEVQIDDVPVWRGFVSAIERDGNDTVTLRCRDEWYHAGRNDVAIPNTIARRVIAVNPTGNTITVTENLPAAGEIVGRWAVINHVDGVVRYVDDVAGNESGKAVDNTPDRAHVSGPLSRTELEDATYQESRFSNDVFFPPAMGLSATSTYTVQRAAVVNQVPDTCTLIIRGHVDLVAAAYETWLDVEIYNVDADDWVLETRVFKATGIWSYGMPVVIDRDLDSRFIDTDGGNWTVKWRWHAQRLAGSLPVRVHAYAGYTRARFEGRKLEGYVPPQGVIVSRPSPTTLVLQTHPPASEIAAAGDGIIIANGFHAAFHRLAGRTGFQYVIPWLDEAAVFDDRGNNEFEVFKRLMQRTNRKFWTVIGASITVLALVAATTFVIDPAQLPEVSDVGDISGWTIHTARELRVSVDSDADGRYVKIPVTALEAFPPAQRDRPDLVYVPGGAFDLDSEPVVTLEAAELEFSFVSAIFRPRMNVHFPTTDTVTGYPYLSLVETVFAGPGGVVVQLHADADTATSTYVLYPQVHPYHAVVRVEFGNDTLRLLTRNTAIDPSHPVFAGDDWHLLQEIAWTGGDVRVMAFDADLDDYGGELDETEIQVRRVALEFPEPAPGATRPFAASGDTTEQAQDTYGSVLALGRDDLQVGPLATGQPGGQRILVTGLGSLAELQLAAHAERDRLSEPAYSIQFSGVISHQVFKVGSFYSFTLHGEPRVEQLRRASFMFDARRNTPVWELEFGPGSTFGRERLFNATRDLEGDIREIRL